MFASGGDDGLVLLWAMFPPSLQQTGRHHTKPVTAVVFAPWTAALVSTSLDLDICVW